MHDKRITTFQFTPNCMFWGGCSVSTGERPTWPIQTSQCLTKKDDKYWGHDPQSQLSWVGHVIRMDDHRLTKQHLYGELGCGKRNTHLVHSDIYQRSSSLKLQTDFTGVLSSDKPRPTLRNKVERPSWTQERWASPCHHIFAPWTPHRPFENWTPKTPTMSQQAWAFPSPTLREKQS